MTLLAHPAWADDDTAENRVAEAVVALGDRRLDEALRLLDRAQAEGKSPTMLAKIERQRAFVLVALDRAEDALAALVRARRLDPALRIGARAPSRALQTLFDCAGTLAAEGSAPIGRLVADGVGGWMCPAGQGPKAGAEVPKAVAAPKGVEEPAPPGSAPRSVALHDAPPVAREAASPAVVEMSPPPPVEEARGVPAWSWILGGVAVASAGAGSAMGALAIGAATDRDDATSASGLSVGANVAFGVAGAALIGGALVWLAD